MPEQAPTHLINLQQAQLEDLVSVDWQPLEDWQPGQALRLDVDAEPQPEWAQASVIAVDFPAFNDGRGLSLGVLLSTRLGFAGEIRAIGAVHEDILHYMVRCGFTHAELPAERDAQVALTLISPYSAYYQGSVGTPEPVFAR